MKRLLLLAILAFLFLFASAQSSIKFQHITTENGLLEGHILSIYQDKEGYLWFGTYAGLHRYNGKSFRVYRNGQDSSTLNNGAVRAMMEDSHGVFWLGTENGLHIYNRETDNFQRFVNNPKDENSLGFNGIRSIVEDRSGLIWIGTYGGGLDMYDRTTKIFKHFRHAANDYGSLPSDVVNTLYLDHADRLWVGTEYGGVSVLDRQTNKFKNYLHDTHNSNSLPDDIITNIIQDKDGIFWIGTWKGGLSRFDEKTQTFKTYSSTNKTGSLSSNTVTKIFIDNKNRMWVSTFTEGLNLYNPKDDNFIVYKNSLTNPSSLLSNDLWTIYQDKEDLLWIGTFGNGITCFNPYANSFDVYTESSGKQDGLISNGILSIFEDSKHNIWIGTKRGIQLLDINTRTFKNFTELGSEGTSEIQSICEDKQGRIWFAGGQVFKYDPRTKKSAVYNTNANAQHGSLYSIVQDDDGDYWMGGWRSGLIKLPKDEAEKANPNDAKFITYLPDNSKAGSISSDIIWNIQNYKPGMLLIGTPLTLTSFNKKTQTFSDTIIHNSPMLSAYYNKDKNYWLFDGPSGLLKMDNQLVKSESFPILKDQINVSIASIVVDNAGIIWCGTDKGLYSLNLQTKQLKTYNESDGLPNHNFFIGAVAKIHDGNLIFGTDKGLVIFDPVKLKMNHYIPPIKITDILVNGKSISLERADKSDVRLTKTIDRTDEIILTHNDYAISLEFSALSYPNPSKNKYSYKLINFDKQWYFSENENKATYTNLAPGKYEFVIRASNNHDVWNNDGRKITIIVLPPWWNTWWFRTFAIIALVTIVLSFYFYKINEIKRENIILEQKVNERTAEVMQQKEELQTQAEHLDTANKHLEKINVDLGNSNNLLNQQKEELRSQKEELQYQAKILETQKKELELLNATKDKFFSILSHDLKNPFGSVVQLSKILFENILIFEKEKSAEVIQMIYESGEKTYQLLLNLLEWSRSQRGLIDYEPSNFDVAALIKDNIDLSMATAQKNQIKLVSNIAPNSVVYADKNMITTIIRNILSNALKFTPENGTIILSTSFSPTKDKLIVSIADTGIGLPKDHLSKLFRIDVRNTDIGVDSKGKGTGLGLILCKDFITANKGDIWVESELGKGTTFFFSLKTKN